ncbi:MAG: polymer-forming cytoskeletal protein [candidate division WOR-3 bacterium]|nr:MAG: polymer-forming cytoskeletal protein [candidate division WOR-3 bacterium]
MQNMILLVFAVAAIVNPLVADDYGYVGSLPEVEVMAVRYDEEDIAWSGLLPGIDVTAPRYHAIERQTTGILQIEEKANFHPTPYLPATLEKKIEVYCERPRNAQMQIEISDLGIFSVIPGAVTFSGDYNLPQTDTIEDDVTITGGNARINGVISGDLAVMGGTVDISGIVEGDVAVLGGNLDLTGSIDGDAAVFGGNIKNRGTIEGDLHVVGGTVYLDSASVVSGDISMVGGTVERDEDAIVRGKVESVEIKALEKILPRISRAFRLPRMIPGGQAFPAAVFLGMLLVLYLFNLLIAVIFPRAVEKVDSRIEQNVWVSVGLGFALQILFVPLVIILAVSIIGIPLLMALPLAILLATIFGLSALSFTTGKRVCKGFNWNVESLIGRLSLGWLAIMLVPIVLILIGPPVFVIGFALIYVILTISLGGVIYALISKQKVAETKVAETTTKK